MRWGHLVLSLVLLSSACTSSRGKIVYDQYLPPSLAESSQNKPIHIEKITVDRSLDAERIEGNARYILRLLFQKRNEAKAGAPFLSLEVVLKEDSFIREYRTWNTITAEISLFDGPTLAFQALYTEEAESTLSSYSYLYTFLERATREVR
ncbi:MAG: hypothetical protein Kow009_05320 [Spirochaetales bacterium]